ncbi:unnamed protein product [Sphenostylis stenocarpa]|uniref:Uncharacterized protein n=1 Tax=Sphenostylis stenocarpa TaxID=92480 RepID=A0AA86S8A6_9FABA|nr:unnamed protein product [Sphenostylis stenocarpa]
MELMMVDALVHANIKTIETSTSQELKEAREFILRIRRRNLYQACNDIREFMIIDKWMHQ